MDGMNFFNKASILLLSILIVDQCIISDWIANEKKIIGSKECESSTVFISDTINQIPVSPEKDIYMKPGDSVAIQSVHPKCMYYPTNIVVKPGEVYAIDSGGSWKDGWLPPSSPNGWNGLILNLFTRLSGTNFFALCGSIGETDTTAFEIGLKKLWTVPENSIDISDYLYLFANDHKNFLGNNKKVISNPLRVRIRRIS